MPRSWLETRVEVSAELAEIVADRLVELGSPGLVTEDEPGGRAVLVAYFDHEGQVEAARSLVATLDIGASLRTREITDEGWAENWKSHFPPLSIGEGLYVCPPWDAEPPPGRVAIVIDPGMAFGTGHHETTRACLELLERCELAGRDVLDVGTGSGVLSIAALRLGARRAVAVDVDPIALEAAKENAARNGVADRLATASALQDVSGHFEVILANIQLNVLRDLEANIAARANPGGVLIASGLLREELALWKSAYAANWEIGDTAVEGQWVAAVARRRAHQSPAPSPQPPVGLRLRIDPAAIRNGTVLVTGADLHHLRVRRLGAGDELICFDAGGNEYAAKVKAWARDTATLELSPASRPESESPLALTLAQAVLKGDHLDFVVEKATEIGVREIVLFASERSLARPSPARIERLRRIADSAVKQSGRTRAPSLRGPVTLDDVLTAGALLFHPPAGGRARDLGPYRTLTAIVGPEGGFSGTEVERAQAAGCQVVGLGPRILRAETAAVVACSLCQHLWGDLG